MRWWYCCLAGTGWAAAPTDKSTVKVVQLFSARMKPDFSFHGQCSAFLNHASSGVQGRVVVLEQVSALFFVVVAAVVHNFNTQL